MATSGKPEPAATRRPLKVLILKPSSLGDVIQALPVLRLIKRHAPNSRIYWWIERNLAGLLEGDPDLEGLILFDRNNWSKLQSWTKLYRDIRWMREQRFDWVIDLQSLARTGAIAWLANGALTIGLDEHREGARGLFDIAVPRAGYYQHAVDWYLATLPRLGVPTGDFTWIPPRPEAAQRIRARWPVDQWQWIALQPGARWLNKRWPAEYYAALVQKLASTHPRARFAILGSGADKKLATTISAAAPDRCLDLTGKINLPEMIEWVRASALMVSNDTGPMHVAAALRTPLIAIFGPTEPARTGPYGQLANAVQTHLDCVPCMKDTCSRKGRPLECLTSISPKRIAAIAQAHLDGTTEIRRH